MPNPLGRFEGGWFEPTFTEKHNANKDKPHSHEGSRDGICADCRRRGVEQEPFRQPPEGVTYYWKCECGNWWSHSERD